MNYTSYIIRRILYMLVTLVVLSIVIFLIIQLPPGDYVTTYIARLEAEGGMVDEALIASLRAQYHLDRPIYLQYVLWIFDFVRGDMGNSFAFNNRPVNQLIAERLPATIILSLCSMIFTYLVAIPIGVYVATHQYSISDYVLTVVGFIGLATPNFLLALILLFFSFKYFGLSIGGLFSNEYAMASWSLAKLLDFINHLWIPMIVIGTAGTAGLIRVMRATLLDELGKQYVITARAKGVPSQKLLFKYPVRVAINPIISTVGYLLPRLVAGQTIVAIVLSLPTVGPLLFEAIMGQDMFMAGSILMVLSMLAFVGTLISDILLVMVDPRIRFERSN